jgi:hypothetical protein
MNYVVTTRNGQTHEVDSDLTTVQAQAILKAKQGASAFERDLAGKARLSVKQIAWVQILAGWATQPKTEIASEGAFPGILALLNTARDAGKKFPKIKLDVSGKRVVLALNRVGKVNVTDGRAYGSNLFYGAIQADGGFRPSRVAGSIMDTLTALEADPQRVASQHGIATGECCFCARDLTTRESRSVGYGPICAGKFGLEWGTIDPSVQAIGEHVTEM